MHNFQQSSISRNLICLRIDVSIKNINDYDKIPNAEESRYRKQIET